MYNYPNIPANPRNASEIQSKLYAGITLRQKQLQKQIELTQQKYYCQQIRAQRIADKNMREHIMHTDVGTTNYKADSRWRQIGYFIDQLGHLNLDEIAERQKKRVMEREEIKIAELNRINNYQGVQQQQQQQIQEKSKKNRDRNKNKNEQKQVPWKLMRKLREHDVEENKKRRQRAQDYQLKYKKQYHA